MEDPLTHLNWSRFCEYAVRVRKINLDPSTNLFGQKMWNEVAQLMHDEPILPLLRSVSITGNDVRTVLQTTPLVLISPSVREMSFWLEGNGDRHEEPAQSQVLSEACARAPRLETITLAISPWRINLSLLHANPHLRSVSIHAQLTIESLAPLTHLAELRHLSVIISEGGSPTSTLPFPCLRRLSVRGVWDAIRGLLECIQAPHTHSLTLHASHADPTQLIPSSRACLQVAATAFPTLETLLVDSTRTTRNPIWDFPTALDTEGMLMAAVEPLLALRRLRHFTLDLQLFIFRVTSDDVRRFAEAWPDAEELLIDAATADGARAGFQSVLHFAWGCPRLRALRLPAMDIAVGAFEGLEYPKEPHALRDLDVKEVVFSREADLEDEMTAFIQRVFPNAALPFAQHPIVVTDEESGDRSRLPCRASDDVIVAGSAGCDPSIRRIMAPESCSPVVIHDIIHCIIAHLDPDPYVDDSHNPEGRSIRQALARLARTHSTFTKPALSELWRSLPGDDVLCHLLCVLGIANEVPQEDGGSGRRLELCGTPDIRESGWKKFEEYASLVHKIIVDPSRVSKSSSPSPPLLHDTFWCRIATIFGDAPILPRLTAIHFISADARRSIDMGALRLLNSGVRELTIEYSSLPLGHVGRLETAFANCFPSTPKLERLSLKLDCPLVDLDALPQSHPHLRHLRVSATIDPHCLTSLAALPHLESLSISLFARVNVHTTLRFKRLLSLSVYRLGLDTASPLLTPVEAPRLRKLFISTSHVDPRGFRAELFQSLLPFAERFPCLTTFHWSCSFVALSNGYPAPGDPATLADLIEPLLSLRTLRNLSLEVRGPVVPYSSADLGRMAEAWPDLETLTLILELMYYGEWSAVLRLVPPKSLPGTGTGGSGAAYGLVQHADYDAFAAFARHCPRLRSLRIPRVRIDADADIPSLPSGCPTSHGLRHLLVCELLGLDPEVPDERRDAQSRRNGAFLKMMKQVFPHADVHLSVSIDDV